MKRLIDDKVVKPIIEKLSWDMRRGIEEDYETLPQGGLAGIFERAGLTE